MIGSASDPPQPPPIEYRFRLHHWQWLGVSILLLVPILAVAGFFGERTTDVSVRTATLSVDLRYYSRLRYGLINSLNFEVTNTTAEAMERVEIALDTAYVTRFSGAAAVPRFVEAFTIDLGVLAPGESRHATVELTGRAYGRHRGQAVIASSTGDAVRLDLSTLVFP